MADWNDVMAARRQTDEYASNAKEVVRDGDYHALVLSNLAIAAAVREVGIIIDHALHGIARR